jgi:hypothetical protein
MEHRYDQDYSDHDIVTWQEKEMEEIKDRKRRTLICFKMAESENLTREKVRLENELEFTNRKNTQREAVNKVGKNKVQMKQIEDTEMLDVLLGLTEFEQVLFSMGCKDKFISLNNLKVNDYSSKTRKASEYFHYLVVLDAQ